MLNNEFFQDPLECDGHIQACVWLPEGIVSFNPLNSTSTNYLWQLNNVKDKTNWYTFDFQLGEERHVSQVIGGCPAVCDEVQAAIVLLGVLLFC